MSKILLIGCGHMGTALVMSWLSLKAYSFTVVDPYNFIKIIFFVADNSMFIFRLFSSSCHNSATFDDCRPLNGKKYYNALETKNP